MPESNISSLMKMVESIQQDYRILSSDSKRKFPHIKETMVICLQLCSSKAPATANTAAAAVRQCSSAIFDRIPVASAVGKTKDANSSSRRPSLKSSDIVAPNPSALCPESSDAYMFIQDICQLLNDEPAAWLVGIDSLNRCLGLDLIEFLLITHMRLFQQEHAFAHLLKTNISPLVIRLFSLSLKLRSTPLGASPSLNGSSSASQSNLDNKQQTSSSEKPSFPLFVRLIRLVKIVIEYYFALLDTECEIFLSLLTRFLHTDKIIWQRALALEVVFRLVSRPDIVNIDALDRSDHPTIPEGYCPSLTLQSLLQTAESICSIVHSTPISDDKSKSSPGNDSQLPSNKVNDSPPSPTSPLAATDFRTHLLELAWPSLINAYSIVLDASADEQITTDLLHAFRLAIGLCGCLKLNAGREAFITALCKASLPVTFQRYLHSVGHRDHLPLDVESTDDDSCPSERSCIVTSVVPAPNGSLMHLNSPVGAPSTTVTTSGNESLTTTANQPCFIVTRKHVAVSLALLLTANSTGDLLGSSWTKVLSTMQDLALLLKLNFKSSAKLYFKTSPTAISSSSPQQQSGTGDTSTGAANVATNATDKKLSLDQLNRSSSGSSDISGGGGSGGVGRLSSLMSEVFLNSSKLDNDSLKDLMVGLCSLSQEVIQVALGNKDPNMFAVIKLTEMGLVNIGRLSLWWSHVTSHLMTMCKLAHTGLRQEAVQSIICLVKQAVTAPNQSPQFWQNESITADVLDTLSALSQVAHDDVREPQLECVQFILQCSGEQIGPCWLRLIRIIGVVRESYKIDLVRTAFDCFKLIVTDYLSSLDPQCYPACVDTAALFGHQKQDMNISLTAIGSMLQLADFLLQKDPLLSIDSGDCKTTSSSIANMQQLWVDLFLKLANLCLDKRSAVRKSACQTLFNAVQCHCQHFSTSLWIAVLGQVMYPLVDLVRRLCLTAPVERESSVTNRKSASLLLIHHSRDTAAKQWAETVVLTLNGLVDLFNVKRSQLIALLRDDFANYWQGLLHLIRSLALTANSEVSVNALIALRTLIDHNEDKPHPRLWQRAWCEWLDIGLAGIVRLQFTDDDSVSISSDSTIDLKSPLYQMIESSPPPPPTAVQTLSRPTDLEVTYSDPQPTCLRQKQSNSTALFLPTSNFLAGYFDLFPPLFPRLPTSINEMDFASLMQIIQLGLLLPVQQQRDTSRGAGSNQPSSTTGSTGDKTTDFTPVQLSLWRCLLKLAEAIKLPQNETGSLRHLLPSFVNLLLTLANYAVEVPKAGQLWPDAASSLDSAIQPNYISFCERLLQLGVDIYLTTPNLDRSARIRLLTLIAKALHKPMLAKYTCLSQSTWLLGVSLFCQVAPTLVPLVSPSAAPNSNSSNPGNQLDDECSALCCEVVDILRDFLFCQHQPPSSLSIEEFQQHEDIDCKLVTLISNTFLSCQADHPLPATFIVNLIHLLSWGSVQTAFSSSSSSMPPTNATADATNGRRSSTTPTHRMSSGLAVRQTSDQHRNQQQPIVRLDMELSLDQLRHSAFRDQLARLCFAKLLSHAFPSWLVGDHGGSSKDKSSPSPPRTNSSSSSSGVSRAAVQSILGQCRQSLADFYAASSMTGRCPLPRAKLSELGFVFKSLTIVLSGLVSEQARDGVDAATWRHIVDIYPHVVDCVLVCASNGSSSQQLTTQLHHLLRLYGNLMHRQQSDDVIANGRMSPLQRR